MSDLVGNPKDVFMGKLVSVLLSGIAASLTLLTKSVKQNEQTFRLKDVLFVVCSISLLFTMSYGVCHVKIFFWIFLIRTDMKIARGLEFCFKIQERFYYIGSKKPSKTKALISLHNSLTDLCLCFLHFLRSRFYYEVACISC